MKVPYPIYQAANDAVGLFFPKLCRACGQHLPPRHEALCLRCRARLPLTGFAQMDDNPVTGRFWGRVDVQYATALLYFIKDGQAQHLIHQLKYEGRREIGHYLGRQLGESLSESPYLPPVDALVPAPLHPKRERVRGYNQAQVIAEGIAERLQCPVSNNGLRRAWNTASQTRKDRFARFANVSEAFVVDDTEALRGKHLLLVDDIITTGATLEACANVLLGIPGVRVSVAALALAL